MSGPLFVDRAVFQAYLVKPYQDVETIYGDLSRLVVAFLARSSPGELRDLYADLGWKGSPNVAAIHAAAKAWMDQHRSQS